MVAVPRSVRCIIILLPEYPCISLTMMMSHLSVTLTTLLRRQFRVYTRPLLAPQSGLGSKSDVDNIESSKNYEMRVAVVTVAQSYQHTAACATGMLSSIGKQVELIPTEEARKCANESTLSIEERVNISMRANWS